MELRGTILQPWNWHTPRLDAGGLPLWQRLQRDAAAIRASGYTAVWLPPATEATGPDDIGYGSRNWFSFDNTRYGDGTSLAAAATALNREGLQVYHDQVHNHLTGGDLEQDVWCLHVKPQNKNEPILPTSQWFQADIYTAFPWMGLEHHHFDAYYANEHDCWALAGKHFDCEAFLAPLLGCDLDFDSIEVVKKLEEAGRWFLQRVAVDGYRFDAVKHVRPKGTLGFLTAMREAAQRPLFALGEFAHDDVQALHWYISRTYGQISLFDFPLQRKLVQASQSGRAYDMRSLHHATLSADQPALSVSFVHSHDDQPPIHGGPARGHYVGDWFISQAYALILLRDEGYPMVSDVDTLRHGELLRRLLFARTQCTYGDRYDRFDHAQTVGWSFAGGPGFDNSMAVVLTTGDPGSKWLPTGRPHTAYRDVTGAMGHTIHTDTHGWADFPCPAGSTSVWIEASKFASLPAGP